MRNLSWKVYSVIVVLGFAIVYLLPTINPNLWPYKKINLGLDLQGGMHLILEVDTPKAVEDTVERISHEMQTELKKQKIKFQKIERINNTVIHVTINENDQIEKFKELLDKEYPGLRILSSDTTDTGFEMQLTLPDKEMVHIKSMATEQALETIRNRIDEFGVSEPDIRIQGENRLLIQLPGIKETKRAKELIGRTAILEFKLVDDTHSVDDALKGTVPAGTEILYGIQKDPETNRTTKRPYLIQKRALLTGASLTDAKVQIDSQYNEPYVSITFDKKGALTFAKITEENVKKRLAIVLDNTVHSAPVIQEKIPGGSARITGSFTTDEARDLAIVLRAGALPAPVNIIEERTVGPSLGADSIRQGIISMLVGFLLVVIFMIVYYKLSGVIADIALLLNIVFIAAGLAAFQATLTLPGIAGIILTIGMAVDANVLIFERIREELASGKAPRTAVNAGFDRAALTILDANVTTLIATLVLFQFGTGPVKGFAVTLSLGVISSVFTALIFTKIIFDYMFTSLNVKKLSI
ncbi:MAG: protein translocase subunit SecD [Desulfobacterales bacterium]|nr:protein translocase subunit SecD [Desulfobacterales bacterium]